MLTSLEYPMLFPETRLPSFSLLYQVLLPGEFCSRTFLICQLSKLFLSQQTLIIVSNLFSMIKISPGHQWAVPSARLGSRTAEKEESYLSLRSGRFSTS